MERSNRSFFLFLLSSSFYLGNLQGFTWIVNDSGDTNSSTPLNTTLRGALLNAASGDIITFDPSVTSITLLNPLPTITQASLTITSPNPVTIDGNSAHPIFTIVPLTANAGSVQLNNLILQNGLSKGGDGGSGFAAGGGGGAGGGGALYVHTGANVQMQQISFLNNTAKGGDGGSNTGTASGGGGGGFGGGAGADGTFGSNDINGGGGGGNLSGGFGGSFVSLPDIGGIASLVQSGGGGGGSGGNGSEAPQNGAAAYQPQSASASFSGGLANVTTNNGGGGAGAGGKGGDATTLSGGDGGIGIGVPLGTDPPSFGGGGGGGCVAQAGGPQKGGNGTGTGGGGGGPSTLLGSYTCSGGNGGLAGGGGGGASCSPSGTGGQGGFGGGGGAGVGAGGGSLFGGGTGDSGIGLLGGGGGAAMGGAIFVQNGAQLTIGDSVILADSFNPNVVQAGSGGAIAAQSYGTDLFISSGGTVIFAPTGSLVISNAIQSNEGQVGSNPLITTGGIVMNGTGILNLAGGGGLIHTYTAKTIINQGTVQIDSDLNLGSLSLPTPIVFGSGTLEMTATVSSARDISLTGAGSINTNAYMATLSGPISGSGSLTKLGTGTLVLTPAAANTYTGGTIIQAGTVSISSIGGTDSALGASSGSVTLYDSTTLITNASGNMSSSRSFLLQGISTLQTAVGGGNVLTLNGSLAGPGGFIKTGSGNLWLTAANSYSGGTEVSSGVLFGHTTSLQGAIQIDPGASLTFLQPASGAFQGALAGAGTIAIGDGTNTYAPVQIGSPQLGFVGPVNILSGGFLNLNGSLANSSLMDIALGGTLTGTGTTGPLTSNGTIRPGNSVGTLTVQGDLNLGSTSQLIIEITPTGASLVQVTGSASIDGTLTVDPQPGFYGIGPTFTILSSAALSGTFNPPNPPNSTNPNFIPTVMYTLVDVLLDLSNIPPFANFPYANPNEESVGNNINALALSGDLSASSPLGAAISSLVGLSDAEINEALDQMHPAPFSAFAEIQASLGAQLLMIFHRRGAPNCLCEEGPRIWIEPYGHWLQEDSLGYQLGFHARSQGVAAGLDLELIDGWTIGIGGACNDTQMKWEREQGFGRMKGYYGAAYTDFTYKNFSMSLSCAAGFDSCKTTRHLHFSTIDEQAKAKRHGTEILGQLCLALSSGPSNCFTFPYINLDYFYLHEGKAKEKGAPGLNLNVDAYTESTIRVESGFLLQGEVKTEDRVFCLSPLFGVGWAMQTPLHRPTYKAAFENEPIPFRVTGWDYTWQLLTVRLGLTLAYRCLSLYGGYTAEVSPLPHTPYFDQRADARLNWNW